MQVNCQLKNFSDNQSIKILAEKTTLKITGIDTELKQEMQLATLAAAAATILPPVFDLVVKSVKEKSKKNALAYKGEYRCSASEEKFYKNAKTAALPDLTITRVIIPKDIKNKNDTLAVKIDLEPDISKDFTAFRYYVKDTCVINYSIAKTKGRYDYIDLKLEIKFRSISINKGEYKIDDLRTTTISIPMIHVGKTKQLTEKVYSGWIPMPPRSNFKTILPSDTTKEDKYIITTKNKTDKETLKEETTIKKYLVEDYEGLQNNTGLYEIEIIATETNPYKIKSENKQETIESSSEPVTNILKAIVQSLTKEKEKDKN
jgi:hypothetical protein